MGFTKVDPIGPRMRLRFHRAAQAAINDTTAAAVISAKQNHGWNNRTGAAEGSIQSRPAKQIAPNHYRGEFGSYDVNYFIFLELGHFVATAGAFRFDMRFNHGERAFARFIAGDFTLRRAADAEFPKLGANLRRHLG